MATQKKKPETQVTMIDLSIIAPDPGNPRKSADADGLRELCPIGSHKDIKEI